MTVCVCAEGSTHCQALAAQATSPQVGHVGFDRRFVNEHKPIRIRLHRGDVVSEPALPQLLYPRAEPFGRDQ